MDDYEINAHAASRMAENFAKEKIAMFIREKASRGKTRLLVRVGSSRRIKNVGDGYDTKLRLCVLEADLERLKDLSYKVYECTSPDDQKLFYIDWEEPHTPATDF